MQGVYTVGKLKSLHLNRLQRDDISKFQNQTFQKTMRGISLSLSLPSILSSHSHTHHLYVSANYQTEGEIYFINTLTV